MSANLTDRDYELITAYLDGEMRDAERLSFEIRLASEPNLRAELDSIGQAVQLINALPLRKAPRDFTLKPAATNPSKTPASPRPPARWLIFPATPLFSALSTAAALALVILGGLLLTFNDSSLAPVPVPVMDIMSTREAPAPTPLPTIEARAGQSVLIAPETPASEVEADAALSILVDPIEEEADGVMRVPAPGQADSVEETAPLDFQAETEIESVSPPAGEAAPQPPPAPQVVLESSRTDDMRPIGYAALVGGMLLLLVALGTLRAGRRAARQ